MILNFAEEAAKRRDRLPRTAPHKSLGSDERRSTPALPRVEFGSGWYHLEAVKDESRHLLTRD